MDSSPSLSCTGKSSKFHSRTFTAKSLKKSITGKSCSICLSAVEDRRAAVVNPCMHAYCIGCIRKWSNFKRKCPLCNSGFDSWFFNINLSSQTFQKERLPIPAAPTEGKDVISQDIQARRRRLIHERRRLIRRSREELNAFISSRTRELPRQRAFGRRGEEDPDVIAKRVLQWRASIYRQRLQAVPFSSKNCLMPQLVGSGDAQRMLLRRIEPWIQRELHAVLGDPDPSVIVHVVTSLFISTYQQKQHCPSAQLRVQNDFLAPLRPFLDEKTEMFWHELRCFAESSLLMDTYDGVVKYNRFSVQVLVGGPQWARNIVSSYIGTKAIRKIHVCSTIGIGLLGYRAAGLCS
ncbi:hypothetical protein ACH5RR_033444 [Cinchona calisaya]|uniref:RING-type E3 ubiquitin transferase n=1 Tax=Cinchona calisaya TaxID=153742 RepID=A0ABD2YKZ7_9GENT